MSKSRKIRLMEAFNDFESLMRQKVAFFSEALSAHGMNHTQWLALSIVGSRKNVVLRDIATALAVTPSAATQIINKFVARGLVARVAASGDRRRVTVRLTKRGQSILDDMSDRHLEHFIAISDAFNDREFDIFIKAFGRFLEVAKGHGAPIPMRAKK